MTVNPKDQLFRGVEILRPVLDGFVFDLIEEGVGSGGGYVVGRFQTNDRYIELHYRLALGIVRFGWNDLSIDIADLARVAGVHPDFPSFDVSDGLSNFRALANDLRTWLSPFVKGESFDEFREAVQQLRPRNLP